MLKQIDVLQAKEMIDAQSVIFVDVRDKVSFEANHPQGAIHLAVEQLEHFIVNADKYTPIIIICYHGISSVSVGEYLVADGFANVYSVLGGFEEWKRIFPED